MGIPLDGKFEGGVNSPRCFAADETPKYIYASISGMVAGTLGLPPGDKLPNGIYKLTQNNSVPWIWSHLAALWAIDVFQRVTHAEFRLTLYYMGWIQFYDEQPPCSWDFTNDFTDPTRQYVGGFASVNWTGGSVTTSLTALSDLLNMSESDKSFTDFTPTDGSDKNIVKFADESLSTNILVEWDKP